MSWIKRHPWLACFLLASGLRVPAAFLIEAFPIFPSYYYEDSRLTDANARQIATTGRIPAGSAAMRAHAVLTAGLYRLVGHRPAVAGAVAGVSAAGAFAFLAAALARRFGERPALAFTILAAAWPSNVFYTSQNLKEPWVIALCFIALALMLDILGGRASIARALGATLALAACGYLRAYVLAGAALAAVFAAVVDCARRRRLTAAALIGLAIGAVVVFKLSTRFLYSGGPLTAHGYAGDPETKPNIIPRTVDRSGQPVRPLSPEAISVFRNIRHESDRLIAGRRGREIGTQIYPDARLESWLDLALFVPKSALHVLFMPLPGLYPLEGKPGRIAAAIENTVLVALTLAAAWRVTRRAPGPAGVLLLAFFAIMVCGTAPLEFDLGSASRHKLLYLPMLFPFAFGSEKT